MNHHLHLLNPDLYMDLRPQYFQKITVFAKCLWSTSSQPESTKSAAMRLPNYGLRYHAKAQSKMRSLLCRKGPHEIHLDMLFMQGSNVFFPNKIQPRRRYNCAPEVRHGNCNFLLTALIQPPANRPPQWVQVRVEFVPYMV